MSNIEVSVIVVFRNEERYIEKCIDSIIRQFDDHSSWELILVDGMSEDNTLQIVRNMSSLVQINHKILTNPGKTLSRGWNTGIRHSEGQFIIRPDAHATFEPGYIKTALAILKSQPDTGVVGGLLETKALNFTGKLIREALSMRSGVGNSSFRTGESSGYKDTAVYGLYRKEVFDKAGLFNENLVRHQDTEFHNRILKHGFRIYMSDKISSTYFCRDSFKAIGQQMFDIGYYFSVLINENVGDSMKLRHWIPLFFYSGMMVLLFAGLVIKLFMFLFVLLIVIYLSVITLESLFRSVKSKSLLPMSSIFIIPFMHFNYALGTFAGLCMILIAKIRGK